MPYQVSCWPEGLNDVVADLPAAARPVVKQALRHLGQYGPKLEEFGVKTLGKKVGGLWQINIKVERVQYRVLYFPVGRSQIVVVHVFQKSSPQAQERAYEAAVKNRRIAEEILRGGDELPPVH